MSRFCLNNKGVALYIVLTMLLVVVILANVILSLVLSHSRLTHHQVSRIQAYYAAQAGMNLAMEMLRTGDPNWPMPAPPVPGYYQCYLCNSGCPNLCDINDAGVLPVSINSVTITIANNGVTALNPDATPVLGCNPCTPAGGVPVCICTTVNYAYTP